MGRPGSALHKTGARATCDAAAASDLFWCHCSYEKWVGEGPPRGSVPGIAWSSSFAAMAVKTLPYSKAAVAERDALMLVRDKLQGRAGPHHVTSLVEAVHVRSADGLEEMALVTK